MTRSRLAALLVLVALSLAACNADTEPATDITPTSAKLNANVDWDQGEDVAYWFEYRRVGTSPWTRDDIRDPGTLGGTGRDVQISEQVSGLAAGETYEYRLCGYRTSPNPAGSSANPICFDSDRSSDPPYDYDRLTTIDALPPGFDETTVFSGLTNPTAVRFSSDGRVFVAEKSGLVKVFSGLSDTSPDIYADLRARSTTTGIAGYSGWRSPRTFRPTARSTSSTRMTLRSAVRRRASNDDLRGSDRKRMRGQRPPLAPAARRQRGGAGRGLVPAVPEPLGRQLGVRARQRPLRQRRRGGLLRLRRLWPGRQPRNPCGDPPGGVGAALSPPRPKVVPCEARTSVAGRSDDAGRRDPAPRSHHGRRDGRQPARGQQRCECASDHRLWAAQPVPNRVPPRHQRAVGRGRGMERIEEINRLVAPADSVVENFGWPCYEGPEDSPATTAPT